MKTAIDYAAQFKLIDYATANSVTSEYKNHRTYLSAKQAFMHAARVEGRGIDVAFAKTGDHEYHVWTVSAIDICSDCGDEYPIADMIDLTRDGIDPCKVMVCKDCNDSNARPTCERCNEQVERTTNAIPGDWNSAYWCDACIADPKAQAQIVLSEYEQAVDDLEHAIWHDERDKYIGQAIDAVHEMAPRLAEALKKVVG